MMATAGEDAINEGLSGPKKVMVDGILVEQYGLEELIEADKYLGSKAAVKTGLGMRIIRVEPPGATG